VLYHWPHTPEQPLQERFAAYPWREDYGDLLRAWQQGQTGYPMVDAGMRQLWQTGWMHNRVRMLVASFLVKNCRIPWQEGARWFWDTLVDADLASNTLGWQWTAGCGTDAAPYFRIFNPMRQGEQFDPDGAYIRRWVPELAKLPASVIHQPRAGSTEGGYPVPVVDFAASRAEALQGWDRIRGQEFPS
jgi:deoxyribodipyrimidine photo-lyase